MENYYSIKTMIFPYTKKLIDYLYFRTDTVFWWQDILITVPEILLPFIEKLEHSFFFFQSVDYISCLCLKSIIAN